MGRNFPNRRELYRKQSCDWSKMTSTPRWPARTVKSLAGASAALWRERWNSNVGETSVDEIPLIRIHTELRCAPVSIGLLCDNIPSVRFPLRSKVLVWSYFLVLREVLQVATSARSGKWRFCIFWVDCAIGIPALAQAPSCQLVTLRGPHVDTGCQLV